MYKFLNELAETKLLCLHVAKPNQTTQIELKRIESVFDEKKLPAYFETAKYFKIIKLFVRPTVRKTSRVFVWLRQLLQSAKPTTTRKRSGKWTYSGGFNLI